MDDKWQPCNVFLLGGAVLAVLTGPQCIFFMEDELNFCLSSVKTEIVGPYWDCPIKVILMMGHITTQVFMEELQKGL